MSVGNAVLDQILKKHFLHNVTKLSNYFIRELIKIQKIYPNVIQDVRGKGFLIGLQIKKIKLILSINYLRINF